MGDFWRFFFSFKHWEIWNFLMWKTTLNGGQWRIQDYQTGGAKHKGRIINLLFWPIFSKNCKKMKGIGSKGDSSTVPLPFGSANGDPYNSFSSGRSRISQKGMVAPPIIRPFFRKLHENEEFLPEKEDPSPPLDPPVLFETSLQL